MYVFTKIKNYINIKVLEREKLMFRLFSSLPSNSLFTFKSCTKNTVYCLSDKDCKLACNEDNHVSEYLNYECNTNLICSLKLDRSSFNNKEMCRNENLGVLPVINDWDQKLINPKPMWRCISYFNQIVNDDGVVNSGVCERGNLYFTNETGMSCKCSDGDTLLLERKTKGIPRCVRHANLYIKSDVDFY